MTLLHGNSLPNQSVTLSSWKTTRRPVAAGKHQISQSLAPMRCTAAAAASFHSHQLRSRSAAAEAAAAEEAVVPSFSCSNGRKDSKP